MLATACQTATRGGKKNQRTPKMPSLAQGPAALSRVNVNVGRWTLGKSRLAYSQ